MKPTRPQLKYLENARAVCDAGTGKDNFFLIEGPGPTSVGRFCENWDWIGYAYNRFFFITPAGRAVLEEAK